MNTFTTASLVIAALFPLLAGPLVPAAVFAYDIDSISVTTHYPDASANTTSARLRGYVKNVSGHEVIAWFEWGTSSSMTKKTSPVLVQTSTRLKQVTANVRGLEKNVSYYYRIVVQDGDRVLSGKTIHFKTDGTADTSLPTIYPYELLPLPQTPPPIVVTSVPTEVAFTSARLQGSVLPRGDFYANGYFEWGATPGFGNVTPVRGLGSMLTMDFSEAVSGLVPNATYYYRAVGQTQFGSNWGATIRFVTNPSSSSSSYQYQPGTAYTPPPVVSAPSPSPYVYVAPVSPAPHAESAAEEAVTEVSDAREEDEKEIDEKNGGRSDQTGAVVAAGGSYFPESFLGWAALFTLIAALVGLLMYIVNLYREMQEARMKLEEERAAQGPGRKLFS